MIYRLKVGKVRSANWDWVLRMMKRFPSYECVHSGQLEIHCIELPRERIGEFWAVFESVRGWRQVAVYEDGVLLTRDESWHRFFETRRRDWKDDPETSFQYRARRARPVHRIPPPQLPEA